MYTPRHTVMKDPHEVFRFMREHSFAMMLSVHQSRPIATHLPFFVEREGEQIILRSHMARANEQRFDLDQEMLVIFSGPHAYISPKHYEKREEVPTWNYIAVHAYGRCSILQEENEVERALTQLITEHDEDYVAQWQSLSKDFRSALQKGIVAFEIRVNEIQAKHKLSQNKSAVEQRRIIESLEKQSDTNARDIATAMSSLLDATND